jgi:CHAT domain-containing protein
MSIPRGDLRALLVAESNAPNFPPLTSVREEVDTVTHLMASSSVTIINNPSDCTDMQSVTEALPTAHILHLACHGIQMDDNPLNSHFALGDGNLTIAALMRLKLSHPTLAFLSACETAKGGKDQPDQAVHLAASMLFCGFRSVIATMW